MSFATAVTAHAQCPPNWGNAFPGGELSGIARSSVVFDDGTGPSLYVGGEFHFAGGNEAHAIARWDGQRWYPVGGGLAAPGSFARVNALAAFDADGAGPAPAVLYAGGDFTVASTSIQRLARWNGTMWEAAGSFTPGAMVHALAVYDNGAGPALYAGGDFAAPGGQPGLARYNGTTWTSAGVFSPAASIHALAVHDPDGAGANPPALYVGGGFTSAGGVGVNNIAKLSGTTWSGVGAGRDAPVYALTSFNDGTGDALYAGTWLLNGADPVAKWNGSSWAALSPGQNIGAVAALHGVDLDGAGPLPPTLYAAGIMNGPTPNTLQAVKKFAGGSWSDAGGAVVSTTAYTLSSFDPDGTGPQPRRLYAGGQLFWAGSTTRVSNIAAFDGAAWSRVGAGNGPDGFVSTLLSWDPDNNGPLAKRLLVGGTFFNAGGTPAAALAQWTGSQWLSFPTLTKDAVFPPHVAAAVVFDDGTGPALFIGGSFSQSNGTPLNGIAKWNGSAWQAVGTGINGFNFATPSTIYAMEVFDEDGAGPLPPALFIGGDFLTVNGVNAPTLARYNGSTWTRLFNAGSVIGRVTSMTIHNDGTGAALYISGALGPTPGGSSQLVKWNGTTLTPVGPLPGIAASALASYDEDGPGGAPASLFAGGSFTTVAGGGSAPRIARWNGSAWSAVGSAFTFANSTDIARLLVHDEDGAGPKSAALYAFGRFNLGAPTSARNIARWNGTTWSALGDGLEGQLFDPPGNFALCIHDDGITPGVPALYAAGQIFSAGGVSAAHIARWGSTPGPTIGQQPLSATRDAGQDVALSISAGGVPTLSYQWRRGVTNLVDSAHIAGATSPVLTIRDLTGADAGSYTCIVTAACGQSTSTAATLTITGGCYANCDGSTTAPILNVADFTCFLQQFAAGNAYANCDGSTTPPTLNVADFTCFLQRFAAGCP